MIKKHDITILSYGGTISQEKDSNGNLKSPSNATEFRHMAMSYLNKFSDEVNFTFIASAMFDSANSQGVHWEYIIKDLYKTQANADALIVLYGTDTLAYLANAIQLTAQHYLYKPIILTGAQMPLANIGSDGVQNLIDSVRGAIELIEQGKQGLHFTGCLVAFGTKYINASTVSKISAKKIKGFDAPAVHQISEKLKYKPGVIGNSDASGVVIDSALHVEHMVLSATQYKNKVTQVNSSTDLPLSKFTTWAPNNISNPEKGSTGIAILTIDFHPGSNPYVLKTLIADDSITIIIIRGVGDGNIGEHWLNFIQLLTKNGILVLTHSPFFDGKAGISPYKTAKDAEQAGAIPTFGMTSSMLYIKSNWLLATKQVKNINDFVAKLLTNYVDEVILTKKDHERILSLLGELSAKKTRDRIADNIHLVDKAQEMWYTYINNSDVLTKLGFM